MNGPILSFPHLCWCSCTEKVCTVSSRGVEPEKKGNWNLCSVNPCPAMCLFEERKEWGCRKGSGVCHHCWIHPSCNCPWPPFFPPPAHVLPTPPTSCAGLPAFPRVSLLTTCTGRLWPSCWCSREHVLDGSQCCKMLIPPARQPSRIGLEKLILFFAGFSLSVVVGTRMAHFLLHWYFGSFPQGVQGWTCGASTCPLHLCIDHAQLPWLQESYYSDACGRTCTEFFI